MITRRNFFRGAVALGAGAALGSPAVEKQSAPAHQAKRLKLGVCTYSYWHFRDPKVSVETVIEKAADLGIEGVDFLHRQMDLPEKEPLTAAHRAYLNQLKRRAFAC